MVRKDWYVHMCGVKLIVEEVDTGNVILRFVFRWNAVQSPMCDIYGIDENIKDIVEDCPMTKFPGEKTHIQKKKRSCTKTLLFRDVTYKADIKFKNLKSF